MDSPIANNTIGKTTVSPEVLHKIVRLTTLSVQGVSRMASVGGIELPPTDEVAYTYNGDGDLLATKYLKSSIVHTTFTYSYTAGVLNGFVVS